METVNVDKMVTPNTRGRGGREEEGGRGEEEGGRGEIS